MPLIAPSLLSADFLHLGRDVESVNVGGDIFHLDVMDGTFVPNISFGFPVIEAVARAATRPMDAHLMVVEPWKWVERVAKAGAAMMSVHLEATKDMSRYADYHGVTVGEDRTAGTLRAIRAQGMRAGLVINPDIPVAEVFPYLSDADFVLLMSVYAGFGGQKFIEATYDRIRELRAETSRLGLAPVRGGGWGWSGCAIEIDGGVSSSNAAALVAAGADILVAGSFVFRSADPVAAINSLR